MLGRRWILVTAVAVAVVAWPADARAYKLGGAKWPGGVVTYHSTATAYDSALRAAVQAWNSSGARVRFRPASAAAADLHIGYAELGGVAAGRASLGRVPAGVVSMQLIGGMYNSGSLPEQFCGRKLNVPGESRPQRVECLRGTSMILQKPGGRGHVSQFARVQARLTVAHELGHVLGLKHNHPACAVMSYRQEKTCPKPPRRWQIRCRLVERDDQRGVIARYGGRARRLGRPFCSSEAKPPLPRGLEARRRSDGSVAVTWRVKPGSAVLYRAAGAAGACPDEPPESSFGLPPLRKTVTHTLEGDRGEFCVALWHEDQYGRLAGPATVRLPALPNEAPRARMGIVELDQRSFEFRDTSTDDGRIVGRSWDFGDGATATGVKPTHTYARIGTYTVTLTVTDDRGETARATRTLQVADPPNQPPEATFGYSQGPSDRTVFFEDYTYDPDGQIVAWRWDFGDGGSATTQTVEHTYAAAGDYQVTLTVTDDRGATSTITQTVTVFDP